MSEERHPHLDALARGAIYGLAIVALRGLFRGNSGGGGKGPRPTPKPWAPPSPAAEYAPDYVPDAWTETEGERAALEQP